MPPRRLNALVKPWAASCRTAAAPKRARIVVDDEYFLFLFLEGVARFQNLLTRHLLGAGHVAGGKGVCRRSVEDQGALVISRTTSCGGHGGDILVAGAQLVDNDQKRCNGGATGIPRMMSDVFEKTVHACRS